MKAVMIIYNQANTERVEYMLDVLKIKGFTFFEEVQGRGTNGGEPRRGTHTWPKLDARNPEVGVRAFVWNIEQTV